MYASAGVRPRVDLAGALSNFTLGGHVAHRVLPMLMSAQVSGQYFTVDNATSMRIIKTKRAARAETVRVDTVIGNGTYICEERSAEEAVDATQVARFGNVLDAEGLALQTATGYVGNDYENDVAGAVLNTTTFPVSGTTGLTASNAWSDPTNATPLADVGVVKGYAENQGVQLNAMVLSQLAARYLWNTDAVQQRLTQNYGGSTGLIPMEPTEADLARIFMLDEVIIAKSKKNTAIPGATNAFSSIWSDTLVAVFAKSMDPTLRTPQLGRTFVWTNAFSALEGSGVANMPLPTEAPPSIYALAAAYDYADPKVKSNVVGCQMFTDEVLLNTTSACKLIQIG